MDDRTEVEQDGSTVSRRGFLGAFAAFAAVTSLVPGALAVQLPMRKPEGVLALGADTPDWQVPGRKPELIQASTRPPALGRKARQLNLYNIHTGERVRAPFWQDGKYVPETMRAITRMMRDHRANQVHKIDPKLIELNDSHIIADDVALTAPGLWTVTVDARRGAAEFLRATFEVTIEG